MREVMFRLSIAVLFLGMLATTGIPARAASSQVLVGEETYTVHTGTDAGSCIVHVTGAGTDVECSDGAGNMARIDSRIGCVATAGLGLCAKGVWPISVNASSQLKCGEDSYNVSTGTDDGDCTLGPGGSSVSCSDPKSGSSANADCEHGCGNTSGAGCCCKAGPGCGAGKNCTGR